MTRPRIVLVFAAALLLALTVLIAFMPARLAQRLAGERLGPLRLAGVSGTLWHGHAAQASWGPRALGALDWTLARAPLLAGRAETTFALRGADGLALDGAATHAGERADLRDVALELPAERLAPLLGDDPPVLGGTIRARIESAQLTRGWPTALQARAVWRDATLGNDAVPLGEVVADAAVQADGGIGGAVRDDGRGAVAIAGRYRILPLGWTLQLTLTPRRDDAATRRALARFGKPGADGSVALHIKHGVVW